MSKLRDTSLSDLASVSEAIVSLMDRPAAVIADGDVVLAHNEPWSEATRRLVDPARRDAFENSLRDIDSADALIDALRHGASSVGVVTLRRSGSSDTHGASEHTCVARWQRLDLPPASRSVAVVVLQDPPEAAPANAVLSTEQAQIARLLIRQTLIEENERRRIGQALHDSISQELALIRDAVRTSGRTADAGAPIIAMIDHVIGEVDTLTFDLSPPILEDLGLRPALRWLVENLSERHEAAISFAENDRDIEPRLSPTTRTIIFRGLRELITNAIKHATGAEIVVSCVANRRSARFIVLDTGPGFVTNNTDAASGAHNYGLLSVEQQVRGLGGTFELVSILGEGTRVTITVPTESEKAAAHD